MRSVIRNVSRSGRSPATARLSPTRRRGEAIVVDGGDGVDEVVAPAEAQRLAREVSGPHARAHRSHRRPRTAARAHRRQADCCTRPTCRSTRRSRCRRAGSDSPRAAAGRRTRRRTARRRTSSSSAALRCRVLHTPGHTPGSVCFAVADGEQTRRCSPATRSSPARSDAGISAARRWKTSCNSIRTETLAATTMRRPVVPGTRAIHDDRHRAPLEPVSPRWLNRSSASGGYSSASTLDDARAMRRAPPPPKRCAKPALTQSTRRREAARDARVPRIRRDRRATTRSCQRSLACAARSAAVRLTFDKLGAFPHERSPRVVYVGAREQGARVPNACATRARRLRALGFEFDNDAVAHVTIARVKEPSRPLPLDRVRADSARIAKLALFESLPDPREQTSRYEIGSLPRRSRRPRSLAQFDQELSVVGACGRRLRRTGADFAGDAAARPRHRGVVGNRYRRRPSRDNRRARRAAPRARARDNLSSSRDSRRARASMSLAVIAAASSIVLPFASRRPDCRSPCRSRSRS